MGRPKANSIFFKTWSHDMAYILGFITTDGCLIECKRGYHRLNITNKNKEILDCISKAMQSNHKIGMKTRGTLPKLHYFQIQIRDRIIYADLLKLGLRPRKSKTLRFPKVPREFLGDFIRGCFDGDGSVNVWQDPRWKHPWQIRAVFCSGSHAFLSDIQKCLCEEAGLSNGSIQNVTRAYLLCYSIGDSVKLCSLMYRNNSADLICLRDKREKFEFFKKMRPDKFERIASSNLAPRTRNYRL